MSELQDQLAVLRERMALVVQACDKKYGKPQNPYSKEFLRPSPQSFQIQEWFPGEEIETKQGKHFETETLYARHRRHGSAELSELAELPGDLLETLSNGTIRNVPPQEWAFLDTETTGIQGGAGICPFLVGLGYFAGDDFHMVQYFIRDFDEEPSMLLALGELLRQFELVVTYNGAAFDIPLLETRFTLSRLDSPFREMSGANASPTRSASAIARSLKEGRSHKDMSGANASPTGRSHKEMSHFDFLFSARRLWRNGHGSCRLVALEREIISFARGPDVPGSMIPRAYFEYLQRRPSAAFRSIFTHNVHDVVSLAALTVHGCDRVTLEPAALDDPLDLYSLGRVWEASQDWRRSIRLYEMALNGGVSEPMRQKVLENLAVIYRRAGEHERSLEVCTELMQYPEFSMVGYQVAAIYYERVARDLDAALRVLEEGLARTETKRWKMLLQARWDRLQQKIFRYD